jgi:hypothetical protein
LGGQTFGTTCPAHSLDLMLAFRFIIFPAV